MRNSKMLIIVAIAIVTGIFFSGCIGNSTNKPTEQVSPTVSPTPTISPESTQISQSVVQNKINELENKINSMQQQINDLQTRLNRVDLLKPSNKNLIPNVPFRIEIKFAEWQTPVSYTFKETGELEVREVGAVEIASYKLFPNNNTIKISSKKYDYYGLVLYDDYAAAIYENGWIAWVHKYQLIPPKYNPVTQKYELS